MSEYNLICRICLLQTENLKGFDSKIFKFCIGIDITNSQSSKICESCNKCLMDSFRFKNKCIEAHGIFTKLCEYKLEVLQIKQEFEEEFEDNSYFDATEMMQIEQAFKEEMEDNSYFDGREMLQIKEEIEDNSYFDGRDIILPVEDESDYFLSEDETYLQQMKIQPRIKLEKRLFEICYICGEKLSTVSIHSHIKTVHSISTEKFSCDKCEKIYKTRCHLNQHKKARHNNIKPYACNQCDQKFSYFSSRKYHMVTAHDAEPRYSCHICPYKTQNSLRIRDHINGHTGSLPFKCEVCEKRFLNKPQLKDHMIVHTKTRNHICSYCSKAFGTPKAMKSHIKIHTQERNYVCPVESCSKDFIQNHVLKSHMKAHHPEVEIPVSGTIVSKNYKNLTVNKKK